MKNRAEAFAFRAVFVRVRRLDQPATGPGEISSPNP